MVRQKNRWLLVQLDFESEVLSRCFAENPSSNSSTTGTKKRKSVEGIISESNSNPNEISGKDIYLSLQEILTQSFGLVGAATTEVQVRVYDPKARLAIIKTSREKCPLVRSSLTFLSQVRQQRVIATTIAVSGSARTARNVAWKEVRKLFFSDHDDVVVMGGDGGQKWSKKSKAAMEKKLLELEDRLEKIDSGC
mmetsp:Transcript_23167/g.46452  ORF Transcript_23167/g.46452 Transcript_23167/m.46452 type:complete len:194 (-) Transcript_23167:447-1028(-)